LYLFLAHMDIGYWIRSFQFTIYGQKVYLGILYHGLFQRNIHKLFTGTIFNYIWTLITSWRWSHILLQVDIISTGRYYDDVDITQWNSYSRLVTYKSCQQDNFFVRCRHHQCL